MAVKQEPATRDFPQRRGRSLANIELRQLHFAVMSAELNSFSRAAAVLGVKQSTLSRRIADLEAIFGVKLFERSTRGAQPSANGRTFLEVARRILTDVDNLVTTARAVRYGEVGRLVVGYASSLSVGHLRMALGEFLERFPDIQLDGVAAGPDRLAIGLRSRAIDVALHPSVAEAPGISQRALWTERLMLAVPHGHPLAEADEIYWSDLRREIFVLPMSGNGSAIAEQVVMNMAAVGLKANVISQDTTAECVLAMVPFGKFITIVSETALGVTWPELVFREIHDGTGQARLDYALYWREDNDNPALQNFFMLIGERYPAFNRATRSS